MNYASGRTSELTRSLKDTLKIVNVMSKYCFGKDRVVEKSQLGDYTLFQYFSFVLKKLLLSDRFGLTADGRLVTTLSRDGVYVQDGNLVDGSTMDKRIERFVSTYCAWR